MVKGNVNPDILIKKLVKTGKHAELWPEKADSKEKKQSKSKKKEKQLSDPESSEDSNHGNDKEKEVVKVEVHVQDQAAKNCEAHGHVGTSKNVEHGGNVIKITEPGVATCKTGGQVKEVKAEVKQTVTLPSSCQSPVAGGGECENGAEKSGGGGGSGSGSGGKKKKKKGQKVSVKIDEGVEQSCDAPPSTGSSNHGHNNGPHGQGHGPMPSPAAANHSSPPGHVMYYHQYPQPVYATSYNMAHPTSSHVYASSPHNSYVYTTEYETESPPLDYDPNASHPSDSFELFSDENPNGCSIM